MRTSFSGEVSILNTLSVASSILRVEARFSAAIRMALSASNAFMILLLILPLNESNALVAASA